MNNRYYDLKEVVVKCCMICLISLLFVGCGGKSEENVRFWELMEEAMWDGYGKGVEECEVEIVEREELVYREGHRKWLELSELMKMGNLGADVYWSEEMREELEWVEPLMLAAESLNEYSEMLYVLDWEELCRKYATMRRVGMYVFGKIADGGAERIAMREDSLRRAGDTLTEVKNDSLWWAANEWSVRYKEIGTLPMELTDGDTMAIGKVVRYGYRYVVDGVEHVGCVCVREDIKNKGNC